jgi:hypothetical protein
MTRPKWLRLDKYQTLFAIGASISVVRFMLDDGLLASVLEWGSLIFFLWAGLYYYLSGYFIEGRDPKEPKPPE